MCFSAEASFASGLVVGTIGVATLPKIRHLREIPLGAVPLLFAIHQIEEGMVWLTLEGRISPQAGHWFIWLYILFAHAFLLALSPWSIWLVEPDKRRRRLLVPLLVLGTCLCGYVLWKLSGSQITAQIRNHGVEYEDPVTGLWWFAILYVVATCAPPFLSSYPWMITFGVLCLAGLIVTAFFKAMYLTSMWCALAALISMLVYLHFRWVRRSSATPPAA